VRWWGREEKWGGGGGGVSGRYWTPFFGSDKKCRIMSRALQRCKVDLKNYRNLQFFFENIGFCDGLEAQGLSGVLE